jgi:hypothetical protein
MDSKQIDTTVVKSVLPKQKDPRLDRIRALERDIEEWRYHNSQSNPGAVMELRAMKKELEALKKVTQ